MLFIIFAVLTILAASKRHEVQGQTRRWATGIAAFILIIVASYAMTLAIGLSIGAASNHTTKLDGLISAMHHPVAGPFVSQLVAAPTTILALIFIPRWVFRLAAKTQPKLQSSEPQDTAPRSKPHLPQPTDDQSFQHNPKGPRPSKGQRPARHSRPVKRPTPALPIMITALLCLTAGVTASAAVFIITSRDEPPPEVAAIPPTPTMTPTATALPSLPPPTRRPTAPPLPTLAAPPTVIPPTPPTIDMQETIIQAFASCNGKYQDPQLSRRSEAARSTVADGLRSLESLTVLTQEICPGALDASFGQTELQALVSARQTTPIPTSTPVPTPSRPPTPAPTPAKAFTLQAPAPTPTLVKFSTEKIFATPQAPQRDTFQGLRNALWIQQNHPALANRIKALPWVADGLVTIEADIVEQLLFIAVAKQPDAATALAGMPFLRSPDPADLSAIKSLAAIGRRDKAQFQRVMSHSTIQAGITDNWTPVVATLSSPAYNKPSLIDDLLNHDTVTVEHRSINLQQSRTVTLSIVRTSPGSQRSMDLLEHAVRSVGAFMTEPFPTGHVSLLFADSTEPGSDGTNFGSHVVIRQRYDVDDESHQADHAPHVIAHEIAHQYWSGNANWIDEGMSDLMASVSEYQRDGTPVATTNQPCRHFNSIAELERATPPSSQGTHKCDYTLGERLFLELLRDFGDAEFQAGIAHLYRLSLPEDLSSVPGTKVGIQHVRSVFGHSGDGTTIIERWYDGTQPFDTSNIDQSPPTDRLDTIHGKVLKAELVLQSNGNPVNSFSARAHQGYAYFLLKYSHNVSGGRHEIPLTLVEYYGDGHLTSRTTIHIGADEKYNNGSWTNHHSVGPSSGVWKPGEYWAMIYDGNQKAAQIHWTVQP